MHRHGGVHGLQPLSCLASAVHRSCLGTPTRGIGPQENTLYFVSHLLRGRKWQRWPDPQSSCCLTGTLSESHEFSLRSEVVWLSPLTYGLYVTGLPIFGDLDFPSIPHPHLDSGVACGRTCAGLRTVLLLESKVGKRMQHTPCSVVFSGPSETWSRCTFEISGSLQALWPAGMAPQSWEPEQAQH